MHERVARGGAGVAPLPGPGVYADHDAVDTPALLPDGGLAPGSVPEHLQVSAARPHLPVTEEELERRPPDVARALPHTPGGSE